MSAIRPFRFGALVHRWGTSQEWTDKARRIEAQGYSTLLVPDHLDEQFAPIPALAAAMAATTTLRGGSCVLANDLRQPVVLAKEFATLDLLSGGRCELGIGAGWSRRDYEQAGVAFDPASVRLRRLEEALGLIKGFFRGEPVTLSGEFYPVTDLVGAPRPVQRPHPPILIGGGGPRVLAIAGREANIVSLTLRTTPDSRGQDQDWSSATEAATEQKLARVREAAGERFDRIELSINLFGLVVTDNRRQVARQTAERRGMTEDEVLASPHFLLGTVEQICEDVRRLRERHGISYLVVPEFFADAAAPVVERLAGR